MLNIEESDRNNPTKAICECGEDVFFDLHHDFLHGYCGKCNKEYHIKVNSGIWNCCCPSNNPSIYE
jgi:ribosomal protein S27AE